MQNFKFNAARVSTENLTKSGLCEAVYSGPMTERAFDALRSEALEASAQCSAYVVRLDRALIVMGDEPPVEEESYAPDTPAGAMIVRPDQYDFWQDYALRASKFGIVRTVWVEANARLAYQWALDRSCLRTSELQR